MAGYCPAPGPEDPLVPSLITVVDCNVQGLVHGGYSALFQPSSPFSVLLTSLMTLYVAFLGFSLLLGRTQLRVGDLVLTVVKLSIVLALTTQWDTYQTVVYDFLFRGPQQLASAMLEGVSPGRSATDVFDRLQQAFDALTVAANAYAKGAPAQASPLLGGVASGAALLTLSGGVLLLSSLGVLLAAKVVLGLLLAVGPVFIALLLFDATRGIFEGWLRASLAFAFAPLGATLLLGVALTMLEPALAQLAELRAHNAYPLGPVYSVLILTLVFAGVSLGLMIAGGVIARGFKLPRARPAQASQSGAQAAAAAPIASWTQPRAARIAAATAALDRRESVTLAGLSPSGLGAQSGDRRIVSTSVTNVERAPRVGVSAPEPRLGQGTRRSAGPRATRAGRTAPR